MTQNKTCHDIPSQTESWDKVICINCRQELDDTELNILLSHILRFGKVLPHHCKGGE